MESPVSNVRSHIMASVPQRNTTPEMAVRLMAHGLGFRYRLHRRDLPGTPDIVFPRLHKVIFVHGCFWHRHAGCRLTTTPKTRVAFWKKKFAKNIERDKIKVQQLNNLGWDVLTIWQCETLNSVVLKNLLLEFLPSRNKVLEQI